MEAVRIERHCGEGELVEDTAGEDWWDEELR
jgi:hypothetical protein